jgi:hypothetical protein
LVAANRFSEGGNSAPPSGATSFSAAHTRETPQPQHITPKLNPTLRIQRVVIMVGALPEFMVSSTFTWIDTEPVEFVSVKTPSPG